MRRFGVTIRALMLLSVGITAVMLIFMPDIVPVHYDAAGEMDRLGSKYEHLVFPIATALMGSFFLFMEKAVIRTHREKMSKAELRIFYICGIAVLLWFIILGIWFMGKGIAYGVGGASSIISAHLLL